MAPMINCDSGRMAWNAHPHAALLDGGIAVSNIHASFALRSARRRLHDDGLLCHDRRRAGPQDEPAHKTRARDEKLYCTVSAPPVSFYRFYRYRYSTVKASYKASEISC